MSANGSAKSLMAAVRRRYPTAALLHEVQATDQRLTDAANDWYRRNARGLATEPRPTTPTARRIDGLLFEGNQTRTAIEVKVSRADFRRETDEKRRLWRSITHRFVYLTPSGLLSPTDMPDGCGLWTVDEFGALHIEKRAKRNSSPEPIPEHVLVALAYRLNKVSY